MARALRFGRHPKSEAEALFPMCLQTVEPYAFELVTTLAGLRELKGDWSELLASARPPAGVFLTYSWALHWAETFLAPDAARTRGPTLAILTVRHNGRLVSIWPMVKSRALGVCRVSFLGEPVSHYCDVIVADVPERDSLILKGYRELVKLTRADVVHLPHLRADARLATVLPRLAHTPPEAVGETLEAPAISIPQPIKIADFESRYSTKARKNRRRLMNRLEEMGEVTVACHGPGPEALRLGRTALEFKMRWLDRNGLFSPVMRDSKTQAFFERAFADTSRPTDIRVFALTLNGSPVAVHFGVLADDYLALHVVSHDERFEKQAVGLLLIERITRWAVENGVRTIDFLPPAAPYKLDWTDTLVPVNDYAIPTSLAGRLAAASGAFNARALAKRIGNALPERIRKPLIALAARSARPKAAAIPGEKSKETLLLRAPGEEALKANH